MKTYTHVFTAAMYMTDKTTETARCPSTAGQETTGRPFHRRRSVGKLTVTHQKHDLTLRRKAAATHTVTLMKAWHQGLVGTRLSGQRVHLTYTWPRAPSQHHMN